VEQEYKTIKRVEIVKTVVVLGMHRSGTSALMGVLQMIGVKIPEYPNDKDKYNEKGYFENEEFRELEKKVIGHKKWKEIVPHQELLKKVEENRNEFLELLHKHRTGEVWACKLVRTSMFPEMLENIPNLHILYTIRDPESVFKSLEWRDKLKRDLCYELWCEYNFRIMRFLSRNSIPFLLVYYDDMIDRTDEVMYKIGKFLDIDISKDSLNNINKFILSRLRHFGCT